MTDLKPLSGPVCALAATGAVALIVGLAVVVIPRPAGALPAYAHNKQAWPVVAAM